jgi:hypothetical protein
MWEGGDVWIIGGGPSIPKQFGVPNGIIQQVCDGTSPPSVYSPFMEAIHDKHVIGVNMAYRIGDWIDMVVFGDGGFFLYEQNNLAIFPGLKVSCHPDARSEIWVKYLSRDTSKPNGLSGNPTMVSWNGNSGAAAINVAVHTGAARIILLGFDLNVIPNKTQHWHDLYKRGTINSNDQRRIRKVAATFERHLSGFPVIAEDAKKLGVEIINANPDSAINCFPKFTVKELLWDNS